jgi:hypothetical protein
LIVGIATACPARASAPLRLRDSAVAVPRAATDATDAR